MKKQNKNFIDKFINNKQDIEEIFNLKEYNEISKSMIISIISKLHVNFKDYRDIKTDTTTFEKYVDTILNLLTFRINKIKIIDNKYYAKFKIPYSLDYESKTINVIQNELELLKSIFKIGFNTPYFSKSKILNITTNSLVKDGFVDNKVEVLRDFNGYSWIVSNREIENHIANFIVEILKFVIGESYLDDIYLNQNTRKNTYILNDIFNQLEKEYTTKIVLDFLIYFIRISISYSISKNMVNYQNVYKAYIENTEILKKLNCENKYLEETIIAKKQAQEQLNLYNQILSNQNELNKRYYSYISSGYNKNVSFQKFAMQLNLQRNAVASKIQQYTNILKPENYSTYIREIEIYNKILGVVNTSNMQNTYILDVINFIKTFFKMLSLKIDNCCTVKQLDNLVKYLRYLNYIYIFENVKINNINELQLDFLKLKQKIYSKVQKLNRLNYFSNNNEIQFKIFENIFNLSNIKLQDVYVKLRKEKVQNEKFNIFAYYYEDDQIIYKEKILEETLDISKLDLRLNKKLKMFF